jgi:hypothetical protein
MGAMRKWLRWTLGILAALAVVVAVFVWAGHERGKQAWKDICDKLRARGEPVDLADIVPPRIPDDQNVAAAPIFAEIFADLEHSRLAKWFEALQGRDARDAAGERVFRPAPMPLYPDDMGLVEEWRAFLRLCLPSNVPATAMGPPDEILHYLAKWDQELAEVKSALQRPKCRWPVKYTNGERLNQPMWPILGLVHASSPRLAALAAKRDTAAFTEDIIMLLRLGRLAWGDAPGDYLWATTTDPAAMKWLQNSLPVLHFEEAQLASLQQQLSLISLKGFINVIRCQRVFQVSFWGDMTPEETAWMFRHGGRAVLPLSAPDKYHETARSLLTFSISHRPEGWKLGDMATLAEFMVSEVEPCVDEAAGTILRSRVKHMESLGASMRKSAGVLSMVRWLPSWEHMFRSVASHQTMARQALLWCAIERFRLKHGRIPDKLSELTPKFIDAVPCDPVTGLPLVYARKGDKDYLLYSIGWNGLDDGGVTRKRNTEGDWVWASDPKLVINVDAEEEKAREKREEEWRASMAKKKAAAKKARTTK